jgi:hypothetical protein
MAFFEAQRIVHQPDTVSVQDNNDASEPNSFTH